jgi:trehalose synthase
MLTVNDVRSRPVLSAFERLIGADRAKQLREAAETIRQCLAGGTLWHVNSTPAGGGVAEMLHTLLPMYEELGVSARWAVVGGDERFFHITKRLGVALYGSDGDGGPLGSAERAAYLASLSTAAAELADLVGPRDIVILHDHQTAGLASSVAARAAAVYWRCHVGVDEPTVASERGWDFITPLLDECDALLFSVPWHVPARFRDRPTWILPPFISPFNFKNCDLTPDAVRSCLAHCGLGPDGAGPGSDVVVTPAGTIRLRSAPKVMLERARRPDDPLITQVSRWDRLKDMAGVMEAVVGHVRCGHLMLVGPDPTAIADDIEQQVWYADCVDRWQTTWRRTRFWSTRCSGPRTWWCRKASPKDSDSRSPRRCGSAGSWSAAPSVASARRSSTGSMASCSAIRRISPGSASSLRQQREAR